MRSNRQEMIDLVDLALHCLERAGSGKEYDPSWIRPKQMSAVEVKESAIQAYHIMHKLKAILEPPAQ